MRFDKVQAERGEVFRYAAPMLTPTPRTKTRRPRFAGLLGPAVATVLASALPALGHDGDHTHHHPSGRHAVIATDDAPERFDTNREGHPIVLPTEDESFIFGIFGDRTGGPPEGVLVLADAVRDINLFEPDLVMTVGDLIQGYNEADQWLIQMREFRDIMDGLKMPWFPVAGNHDTYWRGEGEKPVGEHDALYETHFGPLWYAFEHKDCWFVVLYSDEGDPNTGEKNFGKPSAQVMSPEQFGWLQRALQRAAGAEHVFVFLHHPRWLKGGYGDDWDRVHQLLVSAGNVTAVFAGHIHRMQYDGVRDGIEYFTLATTGGHQNGTVPEAGWLHHYNLVTVRPDHIAVAAIPVGQVMDPRAITGEVSRETSQLAGMRPVVQPSIRMNADGSSGQTIRLTVKNPVSRSIEIALIPESDDSRWQFTPDHTHALIGPGESRTYTFGVSRPGASFDDAFRLPTVAMDMDYLAEGARFSVPRVQADLPVQPELPVPAVPAREQYAHVRGAQGYLKVPSDRVALPDGPMTLECWVRADAYAGQTGLVNKTESSEYGFFITDGVPTFYIFIGDSYVEVSDPSGTLTPDRWHHVAGVFDGSESRLYIDGRHIATVERAGERRTNTLPLLVGADVDGRGRPVYPFRGDIDAVRLSTTARYTDERFTPQRRLETDDATLLLLNMDGRVGPWIYDGSGRDAHARVMGRVGLRKVSQ
jgi:hypothetical protein